MGHELNPTLKDLALRQNREITSAQLHDFENTRRYTSEDLDKFVKNIKDTSFIQNASNPTKALWEYEEHKLCRTLSGDISIPNITIVQPAKIQEKTNDVRDVIKATKTVKSTILQLNLLDVNRIENPQKIKIKYPAGLLDEFIQEYQKIIKWLEENKFDALTLSGLDDEIRISSREFEVAIRFLEKMKLISENK